MITRTFLVFILSICSLSVSAQEQPKLSINHHYDDISLNSVPCNNMDFLSFDIMLKNKRAEAVSALEEESSLCSKDMFEQVIRSIDYMEKEERAFNCSIFKDFCYEASEDSRLLYWLAWDSQYEDCYDPIIKFYLNREDCFSFLVAAPLFPELRAMLGIYQNY